MSRDRDLTSDPSAEHLADRERAQAELDAADARSGGHPDRGPRSLHAVELEADDEPISSNDEWDDPERL